MRSHPTLLALVAAMSLVPAAFARADEAETNAAVAKLLEAGWGTTSAFRTAASQNAEVMFRTGGRSSRTLYPAALVLMKQGRYADAQKLVDELLKSESSHLPALRARVWLAAILKNYPGSMTAAEELAETLPEKEAENVEEETALREYVSFLGRIYGFLGGPAASSVRIDERKASEKKVAARLSEGRRVLFEDARDAVLQRHLELTDTKTAKTDEAKEAAEDAKQKTLDEIAEQRQERAERQKELQERSAKLKQELKAELDEIAKADRPLVAELSRLESRASVLNRELILIDRSISSLQANLDREENPLVRMQILNEIDRLSIIGSRYDADLVGVNRLASNVQAQRGTLAARQAKAQAEYGAQIERMNKEAGEMARREKRADAIEKRTSRSTAELPASVLALKAQAAALATYDAFPLEQEKARILESLK